MTVQQQQWALDRANERRHAIANIRSCVRSLPGMEGRRLVASLLADPSEHVGAIPVGRLLCFIRQIGEVQATRWLTAAGVRFADRRVRELTDRQRRVLVRELS